MTLALITRFLVSERASNKLASLFATTATSATSHPNQNALALTVCHLYYELRSAVRALQLARIVLATLSISLAWWLLRAVAAEGDDESIRRARDASGT